MLIFSKGYIGMYEAYQIYYYHLSLKLLFLMDQNRLLACIDKIKLYIIELYKSFFFSHVKIHSCNCRKAGIRLCVPGNIYIYVQQGKYASAEHILLVCNVCAWCSVAHIYNMCLGHIV